MRKTVLGISVLIILIACSNNIDIAVGQGRTVLKGEIKQTNNFALITPGTASKLFEYLSNGLSCMICFDEQDRINYLLVDDHRFRIPEDVGIGDTVEKCIMRGGKIMVEQGVCFFIMFDSGWYAYIADINTDLDQVYLKDVKYFYKKKDDNSFFMNLEDYREELKKIKISDFVYDDPKIIVSDDTGIIIMPIRSLAPSSGKSRGEVLGQ